MQELFGEVTRVLWLCPCLDQIKFRSKFSLFRNPHCTSFSRFHIPIRYMDFSGSNPCSKKKALIVSSLFWKVLQTPRQATLGLWKAKSTFGIYNAKQALISILFTIMNTAAEKVLRLKLRKWEWKSYATDLSDSKFRIILSRTRTIKGQGG